MRRQLPPLNGVRAFEASARHLSFTKAADELAVTQAAVSQQVRRLEDVLQVKLFRRVDHRLELTDAGHLYYKPLVLALDQIADATARLRPGARSPLFTVTTTPAFAAKWLLRRLPAFSRAHPTIDIRLSATNRVVDFADDRADVALRLGRGGWPDVYAERLIDEEMMPVCAPGLPTASAPLATPPDLRHHPLLHDDSVIPWRYWLRAAGIEDIDWARGPRFSDSAMLLDAAALGQGVALGQRILAADDLAEGRLIKPFDLALRSDYAYWFVVPATTLDKGTVQAFRSWLLAEIAPIKAQSAKDRVLDSFQ